MPLSCRLGGGLCMYMSSLATSDVHHAIPSPQAVSLVLDWASSRT